MKFILLTIHFGFWCSYWETPVKVAEFPTLEACQQAATALITPSNKAVCSQETSQK